MRIWARIQNAKAPRRQAWRTAGELDRFEHLSPSVIWVCFELRVSDFGFAACLHPELGSGQTKLNTENRPIDEFLVGRKVGCASAHRFGKSPLPSDAERDKLTDIQRVFIRVIRAIRGYDLPATWPESTGRKDSRSRCWRWVSVMTDDVNADRRKRKLRIIAAIMVVAAFAWGAEIVRQALEADDGGPPLGALCMAVPSIGLLIGAGVVWSSTNRRGVGRGFEVFQKHSGQWRGFFAGCRGPFRKLAVIFVSDRD
jgi:hypothetical protein